MKKNYYAIKTIDGKKINAVLDNWSSCKNMVYNHQAVYKGFVSLEEAINYLGCKNKILFYGFGNGEVSKIKHKKNPKNSHPPTFPKGERLVKRYLDSVRISYRTQGDTLKCINPKTGRPLPYDFELPDEKIIIEVNGKEHYRFMKYFHGTEEGFAYQKYKDEVKRNFAIANGYTFIELKWTHKHSYSWVVEKLQEHGVGGKKK